MAGDDVETIEVPGAEEELTSYFAATLEQSDDADLAQAWVDLLTSGQGRETFTDAGFGLP